ncbi:hypothetical protein HanHA300_Chr13g0478711 [Helianthus annuus]|nr:hypothetical protein HanHA300_Chr13g0478711 [Helianthus annuus]KAJ0480805.1 hypothetical protein HanIR_Chr13g0635771 [Helianthus annuus]KAJ0663401.1 hypothetical protein HanLR1_Chr13g0480841 [Helianthus annuus]KAJ0848837.1 hypothetical protein HanPSC8_Chr13g0562121 [Helianthus annuus]
MKLFGITKNTLKSDVLSLLEECKLSVDDLKVDYNPMVQFPSRSAYDAALRAFARKGCLYRLEQIINSRIPSKVAKASFTLLLINRLLMLTFAF